MTCWLYISQANALIDSLSASKYKLQCAVAKLSGNSKPTHSLMDFIETKKDKQVRYLAVCARLLGSSVQWTLERQHKTDRGSI